MKLSIALVLAASMLGSTLVGCGYGGVAATGDKVVITRNDGFLFGALRKVFVCKVTDGGVANCAAADSP
jgi:hypothetical protein